MLNFAVFFLKGSITIVPENSKKAEESIRNHLKDIISRLKYLFFRGIQNCFLKLVNESQTRSIWNQNSKICFLKEQTDCFVVNCVTRLIFRYTLCMLLLCYDYREHCMNSCVETLHILKSKIGIQSNLANSPGKLNQTNINGKVSFI